MTPMGTWLEQWNITTPLGKGGQGTTFHVTRKNDGQEGVIKILKHQNNEEARRRMFREVANLKTLQGAGCKVPQILDGNTEKFESKDIDLFDSSGFLMGAGAENERQGSFCGRRFSLVVCVWELRQPVRWTHRFAPDSASLHCAAPVQGAGKFWLGAGVLGKVRA